MKAYVTLASKPGAFNAVLDELTKMNLSKKKDVFLLFGAIDILVQVHFRSLDEFIDRWFNPIRALTPQEPMIEKTQTLIVISEGKSFTEEPDAFLFLNTQPRYLEQVQQELQSISNVLSADTVWGPYDVICTVKGSDKKDLKQVISQIQTEVSHIQGTVTAIVAYEEVKCLCFDQKVCDIHIDDGGNMVCRQGNNEAVVGNDATIICPLEIASERKKWEKFLKQEMNEK
jgi:Lrp/AsnC ligand binding domain